MVNKMRVSHAFCCRLIPTYGRTLDVVLATDNVLVLVARRRHAAGVAVVARTHSWIVVMRFGKARQSSYSSWPGSLLTCLPRTHCSVCSSHSDSKPQMSLVSTVSHTQCSNTKFKSWFSVRMWDLQNIPIFYERIFHRFIKSKQDKNAYYVPAKKLNTDFEISNFCNKVYVTFNVHMLWENVDILHNVILCT